MNIMIIVLLLSFLRDKLDFYSFSYITLSQIHLISVAKVEIDLCIISVAYRFYAYFSHNIF